MASEVMLGGDVGEVVMASEVLLGDDVGEYGGDDMALTDTNHLGTLVEVQS
jgi:hypothetical protein